MKNNKNVVLDFTQNNSQPLAVMSAPLAKKLLQIMTDHLSGATSFDIINNLLTQLHSIDPTCGKESIDNAIEITTAFVEERTLIDNVVTNNWDAYAVEPTVETETEPKKRF